LRQIKPDSRRVTGHRVPEVALAVLRHGRSPYQTDPWQTELYDVTGYLVHLKTD